MFEIRRYSVDKKDEWNGFVNTSKNGTFLIDRNYMDYHAGRFRDHSLLVFRNGRLHALLPANEADGTLYSHQGLTYGGLLMGTDATAESACEAFGAINGYLHSVGIVRVVYRPTPHIYHKLPAEEDLYAIFRVCKARLMAREISSAICREFRLKWRRDRRAGIRKCRDSGITVDESNDYEAFWHVLDGNLMARYGVHPVHTLAEMTSLKDRFPDNIRLYVARKAGGELLGGTVLYLTPQTVHAQYISASTEGRCFCVIDAIYDRILNRDFADVPYFDFGKSTEDNGLFLNVNLISQKEGFGARGICYDTYEWTL